MMEQVKKTTIRILHLEDSEMDSDLLVRYLKKSGLDFTYYRIQSREDYFLALATGGWDFIISDYSLGMFDGIEALTILRERDTEVPFLMLSGKIGEELAAKAMKLGANDYLMKGNLSRLAPAIEREIRDARMRREKKIIEHELRAKEQELNQSQKMEALGRLAGGISHDFNNLLAVISLNADSIASSGQHLAKVEEIREAVQRGASMVKQLMAFSKRGVLPEGEFISLNELISQMIPMFKRLIGKGIQITTELQEGLPMIRFAQSQGEQVLLNLVVNARDAINGDGKISIKTYREKIPDKTLGTERSYCVMEVEDSGCGMSPEVQKRIFEPFFTTKETGKGTGLGLSTAYGIMDRSKGSIKVESQPGKGTKFRLLFPLPEGMLRVPEPALPKEDLSFRSIGTKILLVEKDAAQGDALASALTQAGCITLHAINSEAALLMLSEEDFRPDLLVTSLTLSGISGLRLAQTAIKDYDVKKTLILLDGASDPSLSLEAEQANVHILAKPFTLQQLLSFIDATQASPEPVA
jgi:signal transduction histidine kinase